MQKSISLCFEYLIWDQTKFRLIPNQSENCQYILISFDLSRIRKYFSVCTRVFLVFNKNPAPGFFWAFIPGVYCRELLSGWLFSGGFLSRGFWSRTLSRYRFLDAISSKYQFLDAVNWIKMRRFLGPFARAFIPGILRWRIFGLRKYFLFLFSFHSVILMKK